MKILQHGVKPPKFQWEGVWECPKCRSIYLLEQGDDRYVLREDDNQRDGWSFRFDCPTCEEPRWLAPNNRVAKPSIKKPHRRTGSSLANDLS